MKYKIVIWDSLDGFEGNIIDLLGWWTDDLEWIEEAGAMWVEKYPDDIVMLLEDDSEDGWELVESEEEAV